MYSSIGERKFDVLANISAIQNVSYGYEKEIRALIITNHDCYIDEQGYYIRIRPEELIEKIIINPLASKGFEDSVQSNLKKLNFNGTLELPKLSRAAPYIPST